MDTVFIFFSPHLDDAILSCGGYIHQLASQGKQVIIATVFTADYAGRAPMSELAKTCLRGWGLGERPFAPRCEEDRSAAAALGAEIVHFGFQDCIFRQDENDDFLYVKRVVNVPIHPFDSATLVPALQKTFSEFLQQYSQVNVRVFCPLTNGGHVDHVLVRRAIETMSSLDAVVYYEEFPYTLNSGNENHVESLTPYIINVSEQEIQARLDASACYASQIPGLFPSKWEIIHQILDARLPVSRRVFPLRYNVAGSINRMSSFIREYSEQIGGERYWVMPSKQTRAESHES